MNKSAIIFALLLLPFGARAGELLDRIVVTVNGNALLQSDWDGELHYELFMSGRPISGVTLQDRQSALDRIVDQELLRAIFVLGELPDHIAIHHVLSGDSANWPFQCPADHNVLINGLMLALGLPCDGDGIGHVGNFARQHCLIV
jgi:hypothetical protein